MIVRSKLNWFRMLFVWRGSVLSKILPRLCVILALGVIAIFAYPAMRSTVDFDLGIQPFTLVGIALAIFLGFRNNVSYDRFWEGRKLWGHLGNVSRSLARQAVSHVQWPADSPLQPHFLDCLAALSYALKHQLRGTDPAAELAELLDANTLQAVLAAKFRAAALLNLMGRQLGEARRAGWLSDGLAMALEANLDQVSEVIGGCERIAATPIPMPYAVLLHRTVYLFCALLPFGLVSSIGWLTPLFAVFISYTFIALDAIADEIEDPFGSDPNDLPLNTLCHGIRCNLLELRGEPLPPAPPAPADYILL